VTLRKELTEEYNGIKKYILHHFDARVTNLNEPPSSFCPYPLVWVRSWLHPFRGHCEQKAMRHEGVTCFYVVCHPLL